MAIMVIRDDWYRQMTMKQIGAAEFKEHCLSILDEVDDEGLLITKRGRPVAKLIPIRAESSALIGALAGKVTIRGDILSTGAAWDAQP
jgi:prevent-host-death family protein